MPFVAYRAKYCIQNANLQRLQNDDELELITATEGMQTMPSAPAGPVTLGNPMDEQTKYLWVISPESLPIAVEHGPFGKRRQRKRLSHTNLTGGEPAHAGGELWFEGEAKIVINGCSSRYQPRTSEELSEIARSFSNMGFRVGSFGWDPELGRPSRAFKRGEVEWFQPNS